MRTAPFLIAAAFVGCSASALAAGNSQISRADRMFLKQDAQGSLYEQDISQIAAEKATNPQIKQYADMVTHDHEQYTAALQSLAQNCGVALPMTPDQAQQTRIDNLRSLSGTQFDQAYITDAKAVNARDVQDAQHEANSTQNQQIKNFIGQYKQVDQKHEQQANQLTPS